MWLADVRELKIGQPIPPGNKSLKTHCDASQGVYTKIPVNRKRKKLIKLANNIMYLKCDACGKHIKISKSFGGGYGLTTEDLKNTQQFISEHSFCDVDGDNIQIKYEFGSVFNVINE